MSLLEKKNKEKTYIVCRHCGHKEVVNKKLFANILGASVSGAGWLAWTTYAFAGTGIALPLCITLGLSGVALTKYSDELTQWFSKYYKCKSCGFKRWRVVSEKDLLTENRIKSQEEELKLLKKEQDSFIREKEQNAQNKILVNQDIRNEFIKIINEAKTEIDIISPWMNKHVVDQILLDKLNRAAERGVSIKILYGIGTPNSSNNKEDKSRTKRSDDCARKIYSSIRNKDKIHIMKTNTHAKLILCDDDRYLITSFNTLSFDGAYIGDDQREELAELSHDKTNLQAYREHYFNFTGLNV